MRTWLATMPDCIPTSSSNVPSASAARPPAPPRLANARTTAEAMTPSRQARFTASLPLRSTCRPATGVHSIVAALTSASVPTAGAPKSYVGPVSSSATAVQTAEKPAKTVAW